MTVEIPKKYLLCKEDNVDSIKHTTFALTMVTVGSVSREKQYPVLNYVTFFSPILSWSN